MVTRYTAVPSEISIVDRPCVAAAKFFDIHKRDGSTVRRQFASSGNAFVSAFNRFQSALEAHGMTKHSDIAAIRKAQALGSRPLEGDFLHKYPSDSALGKSATVLAIRKAHGQAHTMQPSGHVQVDVAALAKMVKRNRMRKGTGFPPESSNITDRSGIADTGGTNNADRETAPANRARIIGGQAITDVSRSPAISAAGDAIKAAWARGAKRIA
jgi:hypothetical protein